MQDISQAELQVELQRFQGRFSSWLADALEPLATHDDDDVRRAALDLYVRLSSAALDIALAPNTGANLLDMVTMVELARTAISDNMPAAFQGKGAAAIGEALQRSSEDVWRVARKVLSDAEERQLRSIIERWKIDHPEQLHVGAIRLPDLANPGAAGFGTLSNEATGLFSGMKEAVLGADPVR